MMRSMFAKKRAKNSRCSSAQPALLIFVEIKAISRQNSNFQLLRKSSRANAVSEAWRSTKGPETADMMLFSIFSPFSSSIYILLLGSLSESREVNCVTRKPSWLSQRGEQHLPKWSFLYSIRLESEIFILSQLLQRKNKTLVLSLVILFFNFIVSLCYR